ncbi:hypothetical protein Ahy_B05g079186 [Arachis hypogaea]|uniref:Uncharacterized protein n=1 Tax=Arachis hypogaea TaxID=3818 RepID=A0A444Z955_ARAHY|nr:hypothetical protein Ahy_B05g079186 [Arachis hypogaea]
MELTTILQHTYDNVMIEMQKHKAKSKEKCFFSHEDASLDHINDLQNPPHLNLLDGGSMTQPKSSIYHGQIMNYQFKDSMQ